MGRSRSHTRRHARSNPRGVMEVHPEGFGFVKTAEGEFFIPEAKMAGAFDGDLVEVAPLPPSGPTGRGGKGGKGAAEGGRGGEQPAARVVRVVDRAHDLLVGRYEVAEPFGVVVPEDPRIRYDIFTMRADRPDIEDGSLVRVRINEFPTRNTAATGVVEEVLGPADAAQVPVELVIARHKLETEFSEGTRAEAAAARLDPTGALADGYRDLRERFVFTIDPADARDFDDAISLERLGQGAEAPGAAEAGGAGTGLRVVDARGAGAAKWRLGVHIADVGHYVPWGCSMDLDARRRATSVYLVDRVIPMLPEELSCDLCSLRPQEDRRTMTVDLYLDAKARLLAYEIYPALIRSKARLNYGQAQDLLDGAEAARSPQGNEGPDTFAVLDAALAEELGWRLRGVSEIAKKRAVARAAKGGLDFDAPDARMQLDGEGRAVGVDVRRKTPATSLIEESMILANETVAAHLRDTGWPGVFRVHDKPSADKLAGLVPVLEEFPWFARIDREALLAGDPRAVAQVIEESRGRPEGELVSMLVLRSMKRAVYRPVCDPHYGLASEAYLHFTSPIRRYPDLIVHRMLRAQFFGRPEKFDQEVSALGWLSEHSSDMERVADDAARDSQALKMAEYMQQFIGQRFSALVSGVAAYGIYVRLENTAEGLIAVRDLGGEYFSLDERRQCLRGEDTGRSFRLGQRMAVVLVDADPRTSRLDFRPVGD